MSLRGYLAILFTIFLMLHLASCQLIEYHTKTPGSSSQNTSDITEVSPPNKGTAVFELEMLPTDSANEEMQGYIHFIDQKYSKRTWNIIITVSKNISSFSFIELDDAEELIVGQTLYAHYAWKHEYPLMLHTYINDSTLNRGISYVNGNGEVIYMAFFSDMIDESSENIYLDEIEIGIIPNGTYEPQVTNASNHAKDNSIFEYYFNNYIRDENKTTWSYIGMSIGKYSDPTNNGYTQFDIYRIEHTDGRWIEYYAVPFSEKQLETVYKFQYDNSIVPVWIKPAS